VFEREKERSILNRVAVDLGEVAHAFVRLDRGAYGTCQTCDVPIPHERLEAVPANRFCNDHEVLWEGNKVTFSLPEGVYSDGAAPAEDIAPREAARHLEFLPTDDESDTVEQLGPEEQALHRPTFGTSTERAGGVHRSSATGRSWARLRASAAGQGKWPWLPVGVMMTPGWCPSRTLSRAGWGMLGGVPGAQFETLTGDDCRRLLAGKSVVGSGWCEAGSRSLSRSTTRAITIASSSTPMSARSSPPPAKIASPSRSTGSTHRIDASKRTGWSVLVQGFGEEVVRGDDAQYEEIAAVAVEPWAPGDRNRILLITPISVTGRRISRTSSHRSFKSLRLT